MISFLIKSSSVMSRMPDIRYGYMRIKEKGRVTHLLNITVKVTQSHPLLLSLDGDLDSLVHVTIVSVVIMNEMLGDCGM